MIVSVNQNFAGVAEPVDAPDSKSGSGNWVGVQVSPPAPLVVKWRTLIKIFLIFLKIKKVTFIYT